MSKKSRKRNKKILAAIGIGLGAAALASKRKKELGDTETTSRMGSDFTKSTKPTIADVSNTAKKDKKNIPQTTKVNTERKKSMAETSTVPKKRPGITVYSDGSIKAPDKGSGNQVNYANKEKYSTRLDTKPPGASGGTSKPLSFIDSSKSSFAQNQRRNAPVTGTTKPGMKSGGRVKGCGKALRGFGKAMKGNR
jgi:hypothetical protein